MAVEYFIFGLLVKIITGFDDTITNIPILASVTKVRMGKIAFSIGSLVAIIVAIIISILFASILHGFPYYRYISAALIFILAAMIYFDVFVHKPRTKAEQRLLRQQKVSAERFTHLIGIGFLASIATVLDDIIAYLPLFLASVAESIYAIAGIIAATIIEILAVVYFSTFVARIRYKEEIASAGLVVLGILILAGIL
jgi:hypothetical protein